MSQHQSRNSREHEHPHAPKRRPPHQDWRAWAVVGLMLAALAAYLLSFDEALAPGGGEGQQQPIDGP